jgi:hypothetical protein
MRSSADRAAMSPGGLAVSEVRRTFRAWPYRQARWAAARGAQQREVARSPSLKGLFAQRVSLPARRWADMAHCPGVINASRNREAVSLHSVSIASPHGLQAYHISPALRRRLISPERLRGNMLLFDAAGAASGRFTGREHQCAAEPGPPRQSPLLPSSPLVPGFWCHRGLP